ncbi:hypothetical protein [Streptomyces yaizuensis]|uniref:Uncharacterized protein n=1 Tax=Streptomyces yaizuensis TaxID=2989713 RepID=A0AA86IXX3_9ACTN|nr:hypothetical protein [Streptomyces sp. YSPA8]BDT39560.1 hypothetical protein SYYSPA8_37210 [Streptomyces sp. YSPA8]
MTTPTLPLALSLFHGLPPSPLAPAPDADAPGCHYDERRQLAVLADGTPCVLSDDTSRPVTITTSGMAIGEVEGCDVLPAGGAGAL